MKYFGREHLPYGILAVFFFVVFTLFPGLLLFLYPCRFFQKLLNKINCNSVTLRILMDIFQGNYKDGTGGRRDYRYFSGVFFVMRFILLANFILLNSMYCLMTYSALVAILGFSVAAFHPQRTRVHYVLDCTVLFLLSLLSFTIVGYFMSLPHAVVPGAVSIPFTIASFGLPLVYISCLSCYWICVRKAVLRHCPCPIKWPKMSVNISERGMLLAKGEQ